MSLTKGLKIISRLRRRRTTRVKREEREYVKTARNLCACEMGPTTRIKRQNLPAEGVILAQGEEGRKDGRGMKLTQAFDGRSTGAAKRVLPRFGEFCYCCCLPLLPQLA